MSAGESSVDVMKDMFTDSKIADSLKLHRTKLTYTIVHGLARYFRKQNCQKEQLDVYVRYWDMATNEV